MNTQFAAVLCIFILPHRDMSRELHITTIQTTCPGTAIKLQNTTLDMGHQICWQNQFYKAHRSWSLTDLDSNVKLFSVVLDFLICKMWKAILSIQLWGLYDKIQRKNLVPYPAHKPTRDVKCYYLYCLLILLIYYNNHLGLGKQAYLKCFYF